MKQKFMKDVIGIIIFLILFYYMLWIFITYYFLINKIIKLQIYLFN